MNIRRAIRINNIKNLIQIRARISNALFRSPPIKALKAIIFEIFNKELKQLKARNI